MKPTLPGLSRAPQTATSALRPARPHARLRPVTPDGLLGYFTACAAVAGSLVGLLFVAISIRYEQVLGASAPGANRAVAAAGFTALTNALLLSLFALMPGVNLGVPGAVLAAGSLWSTLRTHLGWTGRRDTSLRLFALSLLLYLFELVVAVVLIGRPGDAALVYNLGYFVFGALAAALTRSWQLLQPSREPGPGTVPDEPADEDPAAGRRAPGTASRREGGPGRGAAA